MTATQLGYLCRLALRQTMLHQPVGTPATVAECLVSALPQLHAPDVKAIRDDIAAWLGDATVRLPPEACGPGGAVEELAGLMQAAKRELRGRGG